MWVGPGKLFPGGYLWETIGEGYSGLKGHVHLHFLHLNSVELYKRGM
jgi:hypothetical protein